MMMIPVIEVKEPPVKAIDTCLCCGYQGKVAQLKCGYSIPEYKNSGGSTVTLCMDCLYRTEIVVRAYLDQHKRPRHGLRVDNYMVDCSVDVKMNMLDGFLHVRCRNGHEYGVNAVSYDPMTGEGCYSSTRDFCKYCDVPIR